MLFLLFGCSNLQWFDTYEEAVEYGLKSENITKSDILAKISIEDELFVVFKKDFSDDITSICVTNIAKNKNKFSWFKNSKPGEGYYGIDNIGVGWQLDTFSKSNKDFRISAGTDYDTLLNTYNKHTKSKSELFKHDNIYYFIGLY